MSPRERQARARLDCALLAYHEIARTFGRDPIAGSDVARELYAAQVGLYEVLRVKGRVD